MRNQATKTQDMTISSLDLKTLENFNVVLRELTSLIAKENEFLNAGNDAPPKPLIMQKEELSSHYATLTSRLRKSAPALHAAGKLNPEEMEHRVRSLVAITKENQALLNARKIATATRVDAVMKALAERERKTHMHAYGANGTYGANGKTGQRAQTDTPIGMMHLRA